MLRYLLPAVLFSTSCVANEDIEIIKQQRNNMTISVLDCNVINVKLQAQVIEMEKKIKELTKTKDKK